jgi:tRNA(Ile)-lysidine synthase
LSSIYSRKENTIIRPLLLFSQEEILSFIQRNRLDYYHDPSNEEDEFLRNKIRHHLIPVIEKIEPDINNRVFQTVSIIQEEYEFFYDSARVLLELSLLMGKILPVETLDKFQLAVQRHIIREYIRLLKGNLLNIGFDHIEAIRTQSRERQGLAIPGIELKFHKGYIFPAGLTVPDYNYRVTAPGKLRIEEIKKKLDVKEVKAYRKPRENDYIIIPAGRVQFPLTVRNPQRGDKYKKINTTIEQKVFEMIRASGIPSELRNLCPVVLNGDGQIIWTVGSPVADAFKVTDKGKEAKKFLKLTTPLF